MIMEFTVKADPAQPVQVVVNNVNINIITPAEEEIFIVRADAFREEAKKDEAKTDAEPNAGTNTED